MPGELEFIARADNRLENMGAASSFVLYGPYWAQAATAASSMHKGWMTEGGTRVPAFITYAGFQRQGAVGHAFGNVLDILSPIMEAATATDVDGVSAHQVAGIRGRAIM